MKTRSLLACVLLLAATLPSLRAESTDELIARARVFLGGEKALGAVRSIHFSGTLEINERVPSEADKNVMVTRPVYLPVDIVFEKPYRQKITVKGPKIIETTALDGYDAWQKRTNPANPTQWQVVLLDAGQVKKLRANTLENLAFYSIKDMPGCVAQFAGDVLLDARACAKITFSHAGGVVFTRYFEKSTGRLVKTETDNGGEIREEGELFVEGIRFPKRIVNKTPAGSITAITFEKIAINETFPPETFTVPSLQSR